MSLLALAGLAPIRQNFLHFRKQLLCYERAVFAFVCFAVPAHNSDVAIIGQKIFNGVVGARFSAAKLGEASRNGFECVPSCRKLLVDFFDDFGFFRLRHDISQSVVIDIAERFLPGPFASPQLGAVPSPNILGQIVHIVFGV